MCHKTEALRDFAGGPVIDSMFPMQGSTGLILGQGTKITHASWTKKKQNIKQKQYCNKFSKDF